MSKDTDDKFGAEETQSRLQAALRGARISGHKTMMDIRPRNNRKRTATDSSKKRKSEITK